MKSEIFTKYIRPLLGAWAFTGILLGTFSVSAQTRTRQTGQKPARPAAPLKTEGCKGGWSGIVTYTRVLKDSLTSDEPGIRKDIDRIKHNTTRDFEYKGRAVIDGTDPKNAVVNTKVTFIDTDLDHGEERVWDTCNSRESGHWFIIDGTENMITKAEAAGSAESFDLRVDEFGGTYGFSLKFPVAKGTFNREEHVKKSGHCQPANNLPFDRSVTDPTKLDGDVVSIDDQKIDPKKPDTLSGSKVWGDDGSGKIRTFVYTASWRFTRCPPKLVVTDLRFEHPKFPNYNDWNEISEQAGTIDGNPVKIKATVLNMSGEVKYGEVGFKETFKGDKWDGARPDASLNDGPVAVKLDPGEEREVEIVWDSSGYSWFDDGRPRLVERVKAEIWENNKLQDDMTKNLKVAPKPVVLVHGAWSHWKEFETWQNIFTTTHSYDWKAFPVGEVVNKGVINTGREFLSSEETNSTEQNADALKRYIRYAQEDRNAWHVDIVAHSIGGLIARYYIGQMMPASYPDGRPQITHLVMLGTPNMGSPCADVMDFAFRMTGDSPRVIREMRQDAMIEFNRRNPDHKGVRFSALAGNPLPTMCKSIVPNDGFVPVPSAIFGVRDNAQSSSINWNLTSTKDFSDFVKPHLAIGPSGAHGPDTTALRRRSTFDEPDRFGSYFVNAGYAKPDIRQASGEDDPRYRPDFAKSVKIPANQTVEVEIPAEAAENFGVTFMAGAEITATLLDGTGA